MSCCWILLLLFCCGGSNNRNNNSCNCSHHHCHNVSSNCGCGNRVNHNSCDHDCGCDNVQSAIFSCNDNVVSSCDCGCQEATPFPNFGNDSGCGCDRN